MKIVLDVESSDVKKIYDTLKACEAHFRHRDYANASIHLATEVIFSPITTSVIGAVSRLDRMLAKIGIEM